jgi:hypothetical protein
MQAAFSYEADAWMADPTFWSWYLSERLGVSAVFLSLELTCNLGIMQISFLTYTSGTRDLRWDTIQDELDVVHIRVDTDAGFRSSLDSPKHTRLGINVREPACQCELSFLLTSFTLDTLRTAQKLFCLRGNG